MTFIAGFDIQNMQMERSDRYSDSFSIGKLAMESYLYENLKLDVLLLDLRGKYLYIFNWKDFVRVAKKYEGRWKTLNGYYIGRIKHLKSEIPKSRWRKIRKVM